MLASAATGPGPGRENSARPLSVIELAQRSSVKLHQLLALLHSRAAAEAAATSSSGSPQGFLAAFGAPIGLSRQSNLVASAQLGEAIQLTTEVLEMQRQLMLAADPLSSPHHGTPSCTPSTTAEGPNVAKDHDLSLQKPANDRQIANAKLHLHLRAAKNENVQWRSRFFTPVPAEKCESHASALGSARLRLPHSQQSSFSGRSSAHLLSAAASNPAAFHATSTSRVVTRDRMLPAPPRNVDRMLTFPLTADQLIGSEPGSESEQGTTERPILPLPSLTATLGVKRQASNQLFVQQPKRPRVSFVPPASNVDLNNSSVRNSHSLSPPADPLALSTLFASLPSLAPNHRPDPTHAAKLAIPSALIESVAKCTRKKCIRARFTPTGALVAHARTIFILSHAFLPTRILDPATSAAYLARLKATRQFTRRAPSAIINQLFPLGFGASIPHAQLLAAVSPPWNPHDAKRAILFAFSRPVYLMATVGREVRRDLWQALMARLSAAEASAISDKAELGLLVSVECVGLEEPRLDSEVPAEADRRYCLRERIAIVEMRRAPRSSHARSEDQIDAEDSSKSSEDEEESSDDGAESDLLSLDEEEASGHHTPSATRSSTQPHSRTQTNVSQAPNPQQPNQVLAFPPALLRRPPSGRSLRTRYVSGRLQLLNGATVLAHELVPCRNLSAETTTRYLARAAAFYGATRMTWRVVEYAINRGPTRPFSPKVIKRAFASANVDLGHDSTIYTALRQSALRPLCVVDELDAGEHQDVWQRLVQQASAGPVPEQAQMVVLLGLELIGLEMPRAEDPIPAERNYVIRERYALIV